MLALFALAGLSASSARLHACYCGATSYPVQSCNQFQVQFPPVQYRVCYQCVVTEEKRTFCRPVYRTVIQEVQQRVYQPVYEQQFRQVKIISRRPVWVMETIVQKSMVLKRVDEVCLQNVPMRTCKPVYERYQDPVTTIVCKTIREQHPQEVKTVVNTPRMQNVQVPVTCSYLKPVYETKIRTVTCAIERDKVVEERVPIRWTTCKPVYQRHEKTIQYIVCKPEVRIDRQEKKWITLKSVYDVQEREVRRTCMEPRLQRYQVSVPRVELSPGGRESRSGNGVSQHPAHDGVRGRAAASLYQGTQIPRGTGQDRSARMQNGCRVRAGSGGESRLLQTGPMGVRSLHLPVLLPAGTNGVRKSSVSRLLEDAADVCAAEEVRTVRCCTVVRQSGEPSRTNAACAGSCPRPFTKR